MKRITQLSAALAVTLVLTFSTVALATPKSERSKRITVQGKVLEVNREARTLLVSDYWSKKLYLVHVPNGETFKITFGMNMKKAEPEFQDARKNDYVRMRCIRGTREHLSRLDDGREVVLLTASH